MATSVQRWPESCPFALFLSHDVDQIHDRELFRVLADLNHVRRIWTKGERGDAALALRRVARALVEPKPAEKGFATILEIEARHGFRSTFFVLHDPCPAQFASKLSDSDGENSDVMIPAFRGILCSKVVCAPWLITTGGMCYTIYLYHNIFINFAMPLFLNILPGQSYLCSLLWNLIVILPLLLVLSAVMFVACEKPFMYRDWPQRAFSAACNALRYRRGDRS